MYDIFNVFKFCFLFYFPSMYLELILLPVIINDLHNQISFTWAFLHFYISVLHPGIDTNVGQDPR